jgi:hypothetical protein
MGTLQTTVLRIKDTVQTTSTLANRNLACYQSDREKLIFAYSKSVLFNYFTLSQRWVLYYQYDDHGTEWKSCLYIWHDECTGIWENIQAQFVFWIWIRIHLAFLDPDPGTHWACEIDKDLIFFTLILIFTNFIIKMIET